MLFDGKVSIITGAGSDRGIGFACAELIAKRGGRLVLVDLAMTPQVTTELEKTLRARVPDAAEVIGIQCDVSSAEDCSQMVEHTLKFHSRIDSLINCAGIVQPKPMLEISESELDRQLAVNLKGTFNVCKSVLPTFVAQKHGAIVNVASVAAQRGGGLVGGAHYAASKGGVISLTRSIAREFGPEGIRANVVCPSMTLTGMLDGNLRSDKHEAIIAGIPLRRAGRPEDIAGACVYLVSDLAAYVTGTTFDVNGGSHIR
jgi:NAD(P)-dependent dehydrogenase (short-subunit alcohol dehydrogenase family)